MATLTDVVQFRMGGELYAMDIYIAREIVEMIPITPIPRSPSYISCIINLRGEITNIVNLTELLGLPVSTIARENQKIIVLMADTVGGSNIGIIVDDVQSVIQVDETEVEKVGEGLTSDINEYVKGIIKTYGDGDSEKDALVIWIDMQKILEMIVQKSTGQ